MNLISADHVASRKGSKNYIGTVSEAPARYFYAYLIIFIFFPIKTLYLFFISKCILNSNILQHNIFAELDECSRPANLHISEVVCYQTKACL